MTFQVMVLNGGSAIKVIFKRFEYNVCRPRFHSTNLYGPVPMGSVLKSWPESISALGTMALPWWHRLLSSMASGPGVVILMVSVSRPRCLR